MDFADSVLSPNESLAKRFWDKLQEKLLDKASDWAAEAIGKIFRTPLPGKASTTVITITLAAAGITVPIVFHIFTTPEVIADDISVHEVSPLQVNEQQKLFAEVLGPDGQVIPGSTLVWSVTDPRIASVSQEGNVTGLRPGITTIEISSVDVQPGGNVDFDTVFTLMVLFP